MSIRNVKAKRFESAGYSEDLKDWTDLKSKGKIFVVYYKLPEKFL